MYDIQNKKVKTKRPTSKINETYPILHKIIEA